LLIKGENNMVNLNSAHAYLPSLLDINRVTPYAVGFDRLFDQLKTYAEHQVQSSGFPPYNIRKEEEKYFIDLAVAGLSKKDLEVEVAEGVLTVRSTYEGIDTNNVLHRGISFKKFTRKFTLADNVVVTGAEYANGMLTVALERILPEEKKPKLIPIK
jgi:molecular chaperone IbpA